MIWEAWLSGVATAIGMDITSAGIFVTMLFSGLFLILTLLVSGKNIMGAIVVFVISILTFTVIGWCHYWITLLLTLLIVGLIASKVSSWFSGGTSND